MVIKTYLPSNLCDSSENSDSSDSSESCDSSDSSESSDSSDSCDSSHSSDKKLQETFFYQKNITKKIIFFYFLQENFFSHIKKIAPKNFKT